LHDILEPLGWKPTGFSSTPSGTANHAPQIHIADSKIRDRGQQVHRRRLKTAHAEDEVPASPNVSA